MLAANDVLNQRYRIAALLGQGGFGAVYKAFDTVLDRDCAIKESLDTTSEAIRQFQREAKLLANLSHPNLPRVTDYFAVPAQGQYLVMDFIEGEDLEQCLHRLGRPLTEAEAQPWIMQICDALSYLHSQSQPIIHRDIKPANIRISPRGQAVLVDFGIAKIFDPNLSTTMGARAVTAGYSPPEQYGLGSTDERSDVYSLGATIYTMFTGQVPPASVDLVAGMAPKTWRITDLNPKISAHTAGLVEQAMQINRDQRFSTPSQLKTELVKSTSLQTMVVSPATASASPPAAAQVARTHAVGEHKATSVASSVLGLVFISAAVLLLSLSAFLTLGRGKLPGSATAAITAQAAVSTATQPAPTLIPTPAPTETQPPTPSQIPPTKPAAIDPIAKKQPAWIRDQTAASMVLIPAGEFTMGSSLDQSLHRVSLDAFYMDQFEATNREFAECAMAGACEPPLENYSMRRNAYFDNPTFEQYPAIFVTWRMAQDYCTWRGARLPTEAEWERAARGGLEDSLYPWGNTEPVCSTGLRNGANFDDDGQCNLADTAQVGSYQPNGFGLYDMAGNVWEWVSDWYAGNYFEASGAVVYNPTGPASGDTKVLRGGAFGSPDYNQTVSFRNRYDPLARSYAFGVRCARSLNQLNQFTVVSEPLPTLEPEVEEAVVSPSFGRAEVVIHSVNVRYGPGGVYSVMGVLMKGQTVDVVGRSRDSSFLIVRYDDRDGWIPMSAVTFKGDLAALPVFQAPAITDSNTGPENDENQKTIKKPNSGSTHYWRP